MNLKAKLMKLFRENVNISKKISISVGLLSFMIMLSLLAPVVKADEASNSNAETPKTMFVDEQDDGLEIGPEIIGQPVGVAVKAPTVNPVLYDATTISGGNLAKAKVNKQPVIATVHVTLKGEDGTVKAELSVTPKRGTKWKVDLTGGVKVAKGDKVSVYQQIGEDKSPEVTANAQPSKASTVNLTMPTGKIWIEQTSSNIVNEDEQAEAVQKLKDANTAIAGDIKSVKFSIDGIEHAYYEVTYTDESTSGKVEATNLQIKQVIEYSRGATLGSITIVDNVIKGKLAGEGPFDGIKVRLILNVKKEKSGDFCTDKGCKIDKDSSEPVDVTLQNDGSFSYTLQERESLELKQIVGVSVKEPHKFVSCSTTTVKPVTPGKTEVKDPRKITGDDKGKIIETIKTAYTAKDGTSKLPNGTGDWDEVPAVIQIDDSGNAKIFSGNDVAGTWDNDGHFVPEKNEDGSVKLKDGVEPKITIPAKDLVKNIKPDAPTVELNKDKENITITPNLEVDTDASSISVSYTGKDGSTKTTTATKADDGTWSITGEGTVANGIITLPKDKVKGDTTVTAKVTDKGGIADDDKDPLTSDPGTLNLEVTKAEKVEALGGLDPVVMKKWVGNEIKEGFWKDGVKAKEDAKKDDVDQLLVGATFTDKTETKRSTEKSGEFIGEIKVTFDDGSELVVENQKLMVCDHVTSTTDPKLPNDALDVQFKLGEGVKVEDKNPNTGEVTKTTKGSKDSPVLYKEYKVKPGTDLSTYIHPTLKKTIFDLIDEKADKGYTEPVWKGQDANNANNFVAAAGNNVFTATATKTFKVTVKPNGGTGDEKVEIKKKDETFKLPAANTFTPPNENQDFSGWKIGDDTNLKQPETEITITGDTEINAIWKPIEFKVDFKAGEGASGSMEDKTVTKGSEYELPTPTFTAPKDKVFAGWKVGDQEGVKQAKERITITGNVTLTATWKDNTVDITFDGAGGGGSMEKASVTKGSEYTLPDNSFTAPENKKFDGWMVGTKKKSVGDRITVNDNTIVKAIWKDIEYKVTFNGNTGTGSMDSATVKKGEKYKLPENAFGAPSDKQEFKTWEVDGKEIAPGTEITIKKDTEVKAIWKDIMIKITYDPNGGNWNNDSANRTIEVKKGTTITIMNAPVKDGFKFKYWKGSEYQPGDTYTALEDHTFIAAWEENKKPGTSDVNPSEPGSKDKNGTQSSGTSSLNSKNNRTPNTGDNRMNMLYAFGLAFAACGVLVINRIYRKEK
ncbi:InlB B-repeat-containing protein [Solobacterium moorei]|uniref:InlB B-repeat-containing protein n=1 Tax=Solobacterium moorei TaxID=102148 RepID=UPI000422F839|nr:InlB B-repeat-containing protein [Solobacterium moorei]BET21985.1 hypothetical protein RGT18_15730 [Solobacterium moorei]